MGLYSITMLQQMLYAEGDHSLENVIIHKSCKLVSRKKRHRKRPKAHETLDQLYEKVVSLKTKPDREWIVTQAIHEIRVEMTHLNKILASSESDPNDLRRYQHLSRRLARLERELRKLQVNAEFGGITVMSPDQLQRMISNFK